MTDLTSITVESHPVAGRRRRGVRPAALLAFSLAALALSPVSAQGAYPGDNGPIYFVTNRPSTNPTFTAGDVFRVNPDGTGVANVTNDPLRNCCPPVVSAVPGVSVAGDGKTITYAATSSFASSGYEIYVREADGTVRQLTVDGTTPVADSDPSFSRDGTKIAYVRAGDIWVINAGGGTAPQNLTAGLQNPDATPSTERSPTFSPNGNTIAFASNRRSSTAEAESDYDIYTMNADGTNARELTVDATITTLPPIPGPCPPACATVTPPPDDTNPSFSPDGARIVFQSQLPNAGPNDNISLMNADGTGLQPITTDPASQKFPTFSPDGEKIAWEEIQVSAQARSDIIVRNADGTTVNITHSQPGSLDVNTTPDWAAIPRAGQPLPGGGQPLPGGGQPLPGGGQPLPRAYPPPPAESSSFPGCPVLTANVIRGSAASTTITGTTGADRIFAGAGNDVVDALSGDDCVDLGVGDDRGQGGLGDDYLLGGLGKDTIAGSAGADRLRGESGNDRISGSRGRDQINGGRGHDRIAGDSSNDAIRGDSGNDRVSGGSGSDRIRGNPGNDLILGGSGLDSILGDQGDDRIFGGAQRDRISGGSGDDRIFTARDRAADRVNCGSGRDSVTADRFDLVAGNCERVRRVR